MLAFTVVAMGLSEAYRTGLIEPAFPELEVGDLHPGGEHFDPLNFYEKFGKLSLHTDLMRMSSHILNLNPTF